MTKTVITEDIKGALKQYLSHNRPAELINTYLFFVENKYKLQPVLFGREKKIYQNTDDVIAHLESENKLWHEAEIKITFSNQNVNELTKKIYICPFTGKVFGDNTHPNPQDAIYDWVSKCPENTERVGGLRVKRFFVSEDPDVIRSYIPQHKPKEAVIKTVYSSVLSGKLFNTKESVIKDFKKHYLKRMSLVEVQNQNRYEIEEQLVSFLQTHLVEDKITAFVEAMAKDEELAPYVEQWLE
jgi:hypothetical protein